MFASLFCQVSTTRLQIALLAVWLSACSCIQLWGELCLRDTSSFVSLQVHGGQACSMVPSCRAVVQDPSFRGRRVVTFHNQRDFIFFRCGMEAGWDLKDAGCQRHLHRLGGRLRYQQPDIAHTLCFAVEAFVC